MHKFRRQGDERAGQRDDGRGEEGGVHPAGAGNRPGRRPRLLAAMFGAVAFLANQEWRDKGSSSPGVLAAAFDAYADQMAATLANQEWRDKGSSSPGVLAAAFDAYADQMAATLAGHWH
jgi:hypothetical protein